MVEIKLDKVERIARPGMGGGGSWLPWGRIARWGEDTIDKNFQYGGRPQKWQSKKSGEMSNLQDTGALRESIESERIVGGVDVGYGMHYGQYHRTGTKRMPQRDFGEVLESDLAVLDAIISNALDEWLRR